MLLMRNWLLSLLIVCFSASAAHADWAQTEQQARGQTVYFNAWGGSDSVNRYLQWAAEQVQRQYGITLKQVKITDAADVVQRIRAEKQAGKKHNGSVDLLWVNGENFHHLKQEGLLYGPWAEHLPNWALVDKSKPVTTDFSVPTEGLEAPWGLAQLTFIADRATTPTPPQSAAELLEFARRHPGQVTYPLPPDFHGVTFLKQLLLELAPNPAVLQQPVTPEQFAVATAPLWAYLDQLHPLAWRQGRSFPASAAAMNNMLADGELLLSLTFNPNEAASLVRQQQLPPSAYGFGFRAGTIGNVHYLAIPFNASAKAAAQVVANFLLSPAAQRHKADLAVWGDPSVLTSHALASATSDATAKSAAVESQTTAKSAAVPVLPEPHVSWVEPLEKAWLQRYGAQ
ncbi:MAG: ABC transporter substrate-binding protein [Plesiomonas shigelloides]